MSRIPYGKAIATLSRRLTYLETRLAEPWSYRPETGHWIHAEAEALRLALACLESAWIDERAA
jgi:hypothetical protein